MSFPPIIIDDTFRKKVAELDASYLLKTLTAELHAINAQIDELDEKRKRCEVKLRHLAELIDERDYRRTVITELQIKPVEVPSRINAGIEVVAHKKSEEFSSNKALILGILNSAKMNGLTGSQIGRILKEKYNKDIGRYVYVRLARLRDENKVIQVEKRWKLV